MSPPDFGSLPLELVVHVLHKVETPRDLLAMIETSKSLYQAFKYSRSSILEAVIRNAMPCDSMDFAVTACKAANIAILIWYGPPEPPFYDARTKFIEDHPEGRTSQEYSLCDGKLLLSLYRLWWTADHFIALFVRDAFHSARRSIPRLKEHPERELSSIERYRLQRSFYTFETYRRIFMGSLTYEPHEKSGLAAYFDFNDIPQFLGALSPAEMERLLSVHEYLYNFSLGLCDDARNHIIREVSEVALASAAKPGAELIEADPLMTLESTLTDNQLDLFENDTYCNKTRNPYFVGRGLPFLRWFSNLETNRRIHVINEYDGAECEFGLFNGLAISQSWNLPDPEHPCCPFENHDAGLCLSETGWMWVAKHQQTSSPDDEWNHNMRNRYSLRDMGYVFWDAKRLNDDWGLPDIVPSALQSYGRSWDDDDPTPSEEVAVAQVFKDIPITIGMFDDEEDSIFTRLEPCPNADDEHYVPMPFSAREAEEWFVEY
jgi:hypothetical protein